MDISTYTSASAGKTSSIIAGGRGKIARVQWKKSRGWETEWMMTIDERDRERVREREREREMKKKEKERERETSIAHFNVQNTGMNRIRKRKAGAEEKEKQLLGIKVQTGQKVAQ